MKALLNFTGSQDDPVLARPFTVVDPQRSCWTCASNRILFMALRDRNQGPRFKGTYQSLSVILELLKAIPRGSISFDRDDVLRRVDPEGLGTILGVTVSLRYLHDILITSQAQPMCAWDATTILGLPCLGFDGPGWRAYLMGFSNIADPAPSVSLVPGSLLDFDFETSEDS